MMPDFRSFICGSTARARSIVPSAFTSTMRRIAAGSCWSSSPSPNIPALFTTQYSPPCFVRTALTMRCMSSSFATSPISYDQLLSPATVFVFVSSGAKITTFQSCTRRSAMARPTPLDPPDISTTFFSTHSLYCTP